METTNLAIIATAVYVGMVAYILFLHHKLKIMAWGSAHLVSVVKRVAEGKATIGMNSKGQIEVNDA